MQLKSKNRKLTAFFVCLLFLLSLAALPALAAMDVRTGYTDYDGFCGVDENGVLTGPAGEIMTAVEEANPGWHFVGVEYQRNEYPDKIRQGHGILGAYFPDAGEDNPTGITFTDIPIGTEYGILYVQPEAEVFYEDFPSFDGMTVGVISKNVHNARFASYQEEHGFNVELAEYPTLPALKEALTAGEVQAIFYPSAVEQTDLKIVARVSEMPLYIVASRWGLQFVDAINEVLAEMQAADENFAQTLFDKYYSGQTAVQALTREEEEERLAAEAEQPEENQEGNTQVPGTTVPEETGEPGPADQPGTEPAPEGEEDGGVQDNSPLTTVGILAVVGAALIVICVIIGRSGKKKKEKKDKTTKKEKTTKKNKKQQKESVSKKSTKEEELFPASLLDETLSEPLADSEPQSEAGAAYLAQELTALEEQEATAAAAAKEAEEEPVSANDIDRLNDKNAPIATAVLPDAFFGGETFEPFQEPETAKAEEEEVPKSEPAEIEPESRKEEAEAPEGETWQAAPGEEEALEAAGPEAGHETAVPESAEEPEPIEAEEEKFSKAALNEEEKRAEEVIPEPGDSKPEYEPETKTAEERQGTAAGTAGREEIDLRSFGLHLFLQPGYSVETDKEIGAEALALFQHHIRGMIYPERLIAALREQGEGYLYDQFVFESLCQSQEIRQINRKKFRILVPVSKDMIAQPDFSRWYIDTAKGYQLDPRAVRLDLDVDPEVITRNLIEQIRFLKNKGFSVALKQVGAPGYPFSLLEAVRPDAVVLDESLLLPQSQDLESASRLAELKAICIRLQIPMEAERVDNHEAFRLALEAGCLVLRGNFLSRPVPLEKRG